MKENTHKICGKSKMEKRILYLTSLFIIAIVVIYIITIPKEEKWIYDKLPNNYIIEKKSDTNITLKKKINGAIITAENNKKVSVDDYIAEFKYSTNYIVLKCIESVENGINLKFYIIDTKSNDIYGPYLDEETYNAVASKIIDEELNDWIETNNIK